MGQTKNSTHPSVPAPAITAIPVAAQGAVKKLSSGLARGTAPRVGLELSSFATNREGVEFAYVNVGVTPTLSTQTREKADRSIPNNSPTVRPTHDLNAGLLLPESPTSFQTRLDALCSDKGPYMNA